MRDWAAGLGVGTFVGTSGRVFPTEMKAAPLLRAWLHRLRHPRAPGAVPVRFHMRHRWVPDGHPKLLHLWPVKLLQAGRSDGNYTGATAMREAASFSR